MPFLLPPSLGCERKREKKETRRDGFARLAKNRNEARLREKQCAVDNDDSGSHLAVVVVLVFVVAKTKQKSRTNNGSVDEKERKN